MVMVTMALTMVGSNFDGMAECGCHAGIKVFWVLADYNYPKYFGIPFGDLGARVCSIHGQ